MNNRTIVLLLVLGMSPGVYGNGEQAVYIGLLAGFCSCFVAITGLCIIFHFYCNVHSHKTKQESGTKKTTKEQNNDGVGVSHMHFLARQTPPDPVINQPPRNPKRVNPMKFF